MTSLKICMGSGACVRLSHRLTRIYIDGIPEDRNKTRGLCGNFNGNKTDDLKDPRGVITTSCPASLCPTYTETWRVPEDEDLFDCKFRDLGTFDYPFPSLCTCETPGGQDVQCGEPYVKNTGLATDFRKQDEIKENVCYLSPS